MIIKNLILTFFIIILAIVLIKKEERFSQNCTGRIEGCIMSNPANINPDEIYNCLMNQCNSIINKYNDLTSKRANDQYNFLNQIGIQMKNYFIMLYMNNLEKYYKGLIIVGVAPYMTSKTSNSLTKIEIPDVRHFLEPIHSGTKNYRLINPPKLWSKSGINTIQQIGFILVPMGFKIGLSQPDNNAQGHKCSGRIRNPNSTYGPCIPAHINRIFIDKYLEGGKLHNITSLVNRYVNSGGRTVVWRREPLWMNERDGTYWGRGAGASRGAFQRHFNWHTSVDSTMSSCWLGTDKPASVCHYAYGNAMFKHINVLPDVNFFNKFYVNSAERDKIRQQFRNGNFNSLNGYF
jgi:hypothetical protein